MATVYGSTLDSLMAGRLGQQRADADERNAYRAFLNQVANTGIRSREQQAMDRFRMGDLDVRREDVGGINEFRRGQISNDALRAGAYGRDVDSLISERPLTRAMQERMQRDALAAQLDLERERQKSPAITSAADLNRANARMLEGGGGFSMLGRDGQAMGLADMEARTSAQNALPALQSDVDMEASRILKGKSKIWDSEDFDQVQDLADGMPGGRAIQSNLKKAANALAYQRAISRAAQYGIDNPGMLRFDPETGKLSVGESPYARLMNRRTQGGSAPMSADIPPVPENLFGDGVNLDFGVQPQAPSGPVQVGFGGPARPAFNPALEELWRNSQMPVSRPSVATPGINPTLPNPISNTRTNRPPLGQFFTR